MPCGVGRGEWGVGQVRVKRVGKYVWNSTVAEVFAFVIRTTRPDGVAVRIFHYFCCVFRALPSECNPSHMAGIYFHIPFCKRICAYCDFYRSADLRPLNPLLEAMHRELEARAGYLHGEPVRTIYFGGGTPSLCPPEALQRLIDRARRLFGFGRLDEVTVECNPDDLTEEYVARLARTEIDRLSIGIQSFDDACLRLMNRRHTAAEAVEAVRRVRRAGFRNVTVDLIFGVRGFGDESLVRTLDAVLDLDVEHLSAYHLTIEPGTALGRRTERGLFGPVDEQVSEQEYALVHGRLTAAGYEHYEVSNYARPGFRARHNAAYWSGARYLGIGPGAHSFDGDERRWCTSSVAEYISKPAVYDCEHLTPRDRCNEYVMTGLRTAEGISLEVVAQRFGTERAARMEKAAAPWIDAGVLVREERRLRIPAERFLVSDAVIEEFFEA